MSNFPDVMLDLETTGLNKAHCAIIQLAAVRFNLAERTIDTASMFDRCLGIPQHKFWQEGARKFWSKRPEVLQSIYARMEDPQQVLKDFRVWVDGQDSVMWGKPSHFDHAFLDVYYDENESQIPFHYRKVNDMNSFIRGRYFPLPQPNWEQDLPFNGAAHNALHDCIHQISILFSVMDHTEGKIKYIGEE